MSFTGNQICTSFKIECLKAEHNFTTGTGDVFKLALYTEDAVLTAATTVYSSTNEVVGTGYVAGGSALTNVTPVAGGTVGLADFDDLVFSTVTLTARGALIYNSTTMAAVAVLDFGSNKSAVAEDFTVTMPTADSLNAIIRIK